MEFPELSPGVLQLVTPASVAETSGRNGSAHPEINVVLLLLVDELIVRPFDNVAIVHGRSRQQASVGGQDWSGVFMITDVWMQRGGRWQVVARHGTGPIAG